MGLKVDYDAETDTLYVHVPGRFGHCTTEEVDDIILIDRSIKTKQVAGYEILNFSKLVEAAGGTIPRRKH